MPKSIDIIDIGGRRSVLIAPNVAIAPRSCQHVEIKVRDGKIVAKRPIAERPEAAVVIGPTDDAEPVETPADRANQPTGPPRCAKGPPGSRATLSKSVSGSLKNENTNSPTKAAERKQPKKIALYNGRIFCGWLDRLTAYDVHGRKLGTARNIHAAIGLALAASQREAAQ